MNKPRRSVSRGVCFPQAVVCLLVLALTSVSTAQSTQPVVEQGAPARPLDGRLPEARRLVDRPDMRVSVLANGLTVLLKVHRSAPVVSVRVDCRAGSLYEQECLGSGVSHLCEHLLHGAATLTRTEGDGARALDEIGGNSNACTSLQETSYFINTGKQHLERAVELLADWIMRPTFPQASFDRERDVVLRELDRDTDDADTELHYMTMEMLYPGHPARYPVIGRRSIVQTLNRADIVDYYRRMYVPDNIVVCVVGDLDLDVTLAAVQRHFASFVRQRMPSIVLPGELPMTSPRSATKRMKVQAARVRFAWPSISLLDPDLYALDVLSYILAEGNSSRLVRAIRDGGLAYSVESDSWTPSWGNGVFAITLRLDPAKIAKARAALTEQLDTIRRDLVAPDELNQAKRQKAAEHVLATQTAEDVAAMIAQDYMATGDVDFSSSYVAQIQKVTAEEVREVVRRYIVPQRQATISVLPEGFQAETSEVAAAAGPEPVRKVTLPNGLRCLIRRDPTTPLVAIQSFSLGGVLFEDAQTNGLSQLAAQLALRGTEKRNAQEIARFFDARGGSIEAVAGSNTISYVAQVLKQDCAEAMEVFADVVCHPAYPAQELGALRPRLLDQIARVNEDWRSELLAYFDSRMFKNSPYRFHALGSASVVAKVTREDVVAFHRAHVIGPNTVVAVDGDIDVGQVEALLQANFAALPSGQRPIPVVPEEPRLDKPALFIKRASPSRDVAGIAVGFPGMRLIDVEDAVPMAVLDTVVSGYNYPSGWLFDSLRGAGHGLVYEVHAMNRPALLPGVFQIHAACRPGQVPEVYRTICQQLDRARAGEFTAEELERAKAVITTSEMMETQTSSARATQAALDELYGLGFEYHDHFAERVAEVTLESLKAAAVKYLSSPPVVVVVTPAPGEVRLGVEPQAIDHDQLDGRAIRKGAE